MNLSDLCFLLKEGMKENRAMPCELFITTLCRADAADRCLRYKSEQDHQRFSLNDTVRHSRSPLSYTSVRKLTWNEFTLEQLYNDGDILQWAWEDVHLQLQRWLRNHANAIYHLSLRQILQLVHCQCNLGACLAELLQFWISQGAQICKILMICKSMQMNLKGILPQSWSTSIVFKGIFKHTAPSVCISTHCWDVLKVCSPA